MVKYDGYRVSANNFRLCEYAELQRKQFAVDRFRLRLKCIWNVRLFCADLLLPATTNLTSFAGSTPY